MKLEGLRVLDLSSFLPGPFLSLALVDHGAEVIKIEMPGEGDPTRHIGAAIDGTTVYFRNLNRGKKSVVLDLKRTEDRDALLKLVDTADVFIESFRPGVADRLGIGQEAVRARNPRIVYCSISAFGHESVYRHRPAHDIGVEAMAGLMSVSLGLDDKPAMPGLPVADLLSALFGLSGIMMALWRRERTGKGDFIDMAMLDSSVAGCAHAVGAVFAEGRQPIAKHERTTGGAAFYRMYETKDGRYVALAGQEPKFVNALLGKLGRMDLAPLCLQGPGPHQQPAMDFLEATFKTRSLAEWEPELEALDVCFGGVRTFPEAFADPNLAARRMILRDAGGHPHFGTPIAFRDEPGQPNLRAPGLGEHNLELVGRPAPATTPKH